MIINSEIGVIRIVDWHKEKTGFYVGRPSLLGNPFIMEVGDDNDRDAVILKYEKYLRAEYRKGSQLKTELISLAAEFKERGGIILGCWCAPRHCHAEVIARAIIGIASRMK